MPSRLPGRLAGWTRTAAAWWPASSDKPAVVSQQQRLCRMCVKYVNGLQSERQ